MTQGQTAPSARRSSEEVQAGRETFVTQTTLHGRFSPRACVVHYASTEADLRALLDVVRRAGARLSAST
jgi:hypothetical protein